MRCQGHSDHNARGVGLGKYVQIGENAKERRREETNREEGKGGLWGCAPQHRSTMQLNGVILGLHVATAQCAGTMATHLDLSRCLLFALPPDPWLYSTPPPRHRSCLLARRCFNGVGKSCLLPCASAVLDTIHSPSCTVEYSSFAVFLHCCCSCPPPLLAHNG